MEYMSDENELLLFKKKS